MNRPPSTGRNIFLSYADDRFRAGQAILCESARRVGFDMVIETGPAAWEDTGFAEQNAAILTQPRGGGYWLWKPWLIRQNLEKLGPDDTLFYCDASLDGFYAFDRFPEKLVSLARENQQGFVIGPILYQHGPLSKWTKRDALILLNADRPEIFDKPVVQATWSIWRRTDAAFALADAWLSACCDPRILTDQPNVCGSADHADFTDHRHDQSILSVLAYRDGYAVLDLIETGIFEAMRFRSRSTASNRLLKAPGRADALLRGENACLAFVWMLAGDAGKRVMSKILP